MITGSVVGAALGVLLAAHQQEPRWQLLPSIARVRVEIMREHVVITHDVTLPRGDYATGDLTLHLAYGAAMPFAMDARIFPVADGELWPDPTSRGEALTIDQTRRGNQGPPLSLLGTLDMAGVNVTIAQALFTRMISRGNMAWLRVRELARLPPADARGVREILVRLGAANGNPLTLARVEVKKGEGVAGLEDVGARLCGKDADPLPLYVPREEAPGVSPPNAVAPVLATRHASDDLCIRFKSL